MVFLAFAVAVFVASAAAGKDLKEFESPDGRLVAAVLPVDRKKGYEKYESRIVIRSNEPQQLAAHDFSSADGEHGYGVAVERWTPDSRFFICLMSNSGGHSPLYRPVVFWSRKTNRFYGLDAYTGDVVFSIIATDKVRVKTWPGLEPAIVPLSGIKQGQATELH